MDNIKAVIIDDEKHSVATLIWKLNKFCPEVTVISSFTDSAEGLEFLRANPADLLFLDIEMPRLNGFELLEELAPACTIDTILITAYDEFGIRAVKANVLDYLLKPIQTRELKAAITKHQNNNRSAFSKRAGGKRSRIALATKESIEFVEPEDIVMCSSDSNYSMIYLKSGRKKLISKTLKEVEEWLVPHGFFRAHNSHLVNLNHVREFIRADGGYLMMSNGQSLPVARNRKEDLLRRL